jgi:hypothetical protein
VAVGTLYHDAPAAPTPFAPANGQDKRSLVQEAERPPAEPAPQPKPTSPTDLNPQRSIAAKPADQNAEPSKAATDPARDGKTERPADTVVLSVASLADEPKPTTVEPAPRPVKELDPTEMRSTIEQYLRWTHEGNIALTLEPSTPAADRELPALVAYYVLHSSDSGTTVRVDPATGHCEVIKDPNHAVGSLIGDIDAARRPGVVARAKVQWFPGSSNVTSSFAFKPDAQLLIYRALGTAVGRDGLVKGARYRLGFDLDPKSRQLAIHVLGGPPSGSPLD